MKIKLMSFNTQHCMDFYTEKIDIPQVGHAISRFDPDIIGLNEMRGAGTDPEYTPQMEALAEQLGYHYYFAQAILVDGTNPYGNGFLSRYPILSAEVFPIPSPQEKIYTDPDPCYEDRCLLKVKLDVPGGLTVMVSHFGLVPDEQVEAVRTVVRNLENERCVLMGDFNMTPTSPILQAIRGRMFDTAELFRAERLSYPADFPEKKIDYIFTTKDLTVLSADIPNMVVSDHRPHIAVIEI